MWVEAGQPVADFWRTTLRLQDVILAGAARGIERERLFVEFGAWAAAHLTTIGHHNPKKFPAFDRFRTKQSDGARRARPDWRAMKAMVMAHVAASGGEIRRKTPDV